jgi:hypothetical protein
MAEEEGEGGMTETQQFWWDTVWNVVFVMVGVWAGVRMERRRGKKK